MKTSTFRDAAYLLASVICFSVCFSGCTPEISRHCRIAKFLWDGQWHQAHYASDGRLAELIAPDSSTILFHYNAASQLTNAEIYRGTPTPKYRFKFTHGPFGIVQTDEYHPSSLGTEHNRTLFHYSSASRVDYIIYQEFGADTTSIVPGFQIRYNLSYVNNNVSFIDGVSSEIHTAYTGGHYDKKNNPFRVLAAAVGNNAFFPVCFMANFPVAHYDISFLSLFSFNNPQRAQYELVGTGLDPEVQTFTNTYAGSVAKKIVWQNGSYGLSDSRTYEFEFDCPAASTAE